MDGPVVREEDTGPRVVPALREEPPAEAVRSVALERARLFLQSQTAIIVFGLGMSVLARSAGLLSDPIAQRFIALCGVVSLITAAGWALLRTAIDSRRLVLGLLVLDALVGYPAIYLAGGLGTPAPSCVLLCLLMTPLFAGRRFVLAMSGLHWLIFSGLVFVEIQGLTASLPSFLTPPTAFASTFPEAVAIWVGFTVACFGTTLLTSIPFIDATLQRAQLADEVRRNTAALERTTHKLAYANSDLAGVNSQLQSANAELVTVNADLASVVEELGVVNDQLGLSNAELARTNVELEHTNLALQRSNERLDQFNTAVSHDLRAPLQAMMARAELAALAAHSDPGRVARMADQICDSATRMARQLDELHKLSRLEDRLESVEEVPLSALLGDIVQDLEPKIRARRVNIEVVHPLPRLVGSRALLAEVFQNLVDNAIKYGATQRPRVRIAAVESSEDTVAVAVEDNGPGIPPDQHTRVFQLFRRLTRDQDTEGVGAGLAIVRRIVGVHGGAVSVEDSASLGGARFVVQLPNHARAAPQSPERPADTAVVAEA